MFARFFGMIEALTFVLIFFGDRKGGILLSFNILLSLFIQCKQIVNENSIKAMLEYSNSLILLGLALILYTH